MFNKPVHSLSILAFGLLALAQPCEAEQWCAYSAAGIELGCYGSYEMCQHTAAQMRGACQIRPESSDSPSGSDSFAKDYNEGYAAGRAIGTLLFGDPEERRRKEQSQREQERLELERRRLEIEKQQLAEMEASRRALEGQPSPGQTPRNSPAGRSLDLSSYEKTCSDIGFKKETTAYGECVLELDRRKRGK